MNVSTPDVVVRRQDNGEMPSKALWIEDTGWQQAREELRRNCMWVVRTRFPCTRSVRSATLQRLPRAFAEIDRWV